MGVQAGVGDGEAEGVGVGVGGGVGVMPGDGVTLGVGDPHAPAIRLTSSMTKLPVPLVGPMYSNRRLCAAPFAKAFKLIVR